MRSMHRLPTQEGKMEDAVCSSFGKRRTSYGPAAK
jgi:hypothetical protein